MEQQRGGASPPRQPTTLEPGNKFAVGTRQLGGGQVLILRPPRVLTKGEAFMFAAWLVTMAESLEPRDVTFQQALRVVRGT